MPATLSTQWSNSSLTSDDLDGESLVRIPTKISDGLEPLPEPIQRKSRTSFHSKLIYYFNGPVFLYPSSQIFPNLPTDTPLIIRPSALSSETNYDSKAAFPFPELQRKFPKNLLSARFEDLDSKPESTSSGTAPSQLVHNSAFLTDSSSDGRLVGSLSSETLARTPTTSSAQRTNSSETENFDGDFLQAQQSDTDGPQLLESKRSDSTQVESFSKYKEFSLALINNDSLVAIFILC